MKYEFIIDLNEDTSIDYVIGKLKLHGKVIDVENVKESISSQQMKALHLYFTHLAQELNDKHFDMRAIIRQDVEIEWTPYTIKEYLFRPLMKVKYGKTSVKQLFKNKEIDSLVDIITKLIAERTKGQCDYVPFPNWEDTNREEYK